MHNEPRRPDPDELLRRVQLQENRDSSGTLKVFLGYAPGVGKTYTMLESARQLKAQGVDIMIGYIETHGRKETDALLEGLEVVPRKSIAYRGTTLEEFDIDGTLERKPAIVLLDELAHTNAPGSRHRKRWQDVADLLEAGISVHTTLNIQHVESLNDIVAQITGIQVRETVPDSILDCAEKIEIVDIPPDELLIRLRDGKVYIPEQARKAADHFFRSGNLLALRELTLRRAAERIDSDMRAYRLDFNIEKTWPAAECVLVCVGPSPSSAKIIRGARRMAAGLRAHWIAIYVDAPDSYPMTQEDRERLQGHLHLAESLGAEVVRIGGSRVAEEILDYAHKRNVTRIIVGKPTHSRWRDRLRGSLVNQLVRGSGDIEVHFIAGNEKPSTVRPHDAQHPARTTRKGYWIAVLTIIATVATGMSLRSFFSQPDFVMIFILSILVIAYRYGQGPSILAATLAVASYDFFFVPPYLTFNVEHTKHFLTFLVMFTVGILVSGLTTRLRSQEAEARSREARTSALYSLNRELAKALDESSLAIIAASHAAEVFGGDAMMLSRDSNGALQATGSSRIDWKLTDAELAVARWVGDHGRPAGRGMDTLAGASVTCFPIQTSSAPVGVLVFRNNALLLLEVEQKAFLDAFLRQLALAVERVRLAEETKVAALKIKTEETRNALLSAVSHDLRTPLGAITGAGTMLRDDSDRLDPAQKRELCDLICAEADRMEHLIRNILDMVRLESGGVAPKREWIPLEETIGSALSRMETRLESRPVKVGIPPGLPLLFVDPLLFEQVFINLIENVIRYCEPDCPIDIEASVRDQCIVIDFADRGSGLPAGAEKLVFEKFYRGSGRGSPGAGLGLSICRGIILSHGGDITAWNRESGGAVFRIRLPIEDSPPAVEIDIDASQGESFS